MRIFEPKTLKTSLVTLVAVLLSSSYALSAPRNRDCNPYEFGDIANVRIVPEARIRAQDYSRISFRDHSSLIGLVGEGYDDFITNLPQGSRIFDSGGGYSIYGNDYALRGHEVITANAQDFYGQNLFPLADAEYLKRNFAELFTPGQGSPEKIGDLSFDVLARLAQQYKIPHPKYFSIDKYRSGPRSNLGYPITMQDRYEDMAQFIRRIKKAVAGNGNLDRRTGLVQDVLKNIEDGSQDAIVDVWGAMAYSGDRVHLLTEFARKLKPNGRGYIYIGPVEDQVILENGQKVGLIRYLVRNFPDTFQVSRDTDRTLIIRGGQEPIDLSQILEARVARRPGTSRAPANVPYIHYRVRAAAEGN